MLTGLRIRNFKAWRDTGEVPLAPLTVFFGANSSGKSSLHQLPMLLRQTVESADRRRVLHTGDRHTPVDLGGFADLVRDPAEPLSFELGWRREEPLTVVDPGSRRALSGRDLRFGATISADGGLPPRIAVDEYAYTLTGDDGAVSLGGRRTGPGDYTLTAAGMTLQPVPGRTGTVSPPGHFHAFPDDVTTHFAHLDFVPDLTYALEKQLTALDYLGPLREPPGRLHRWSGEEVGGVGRRGEQAVEALLAGAGRRYGRTPDGPTAPLGAAVARRLQTLGVIDEFTVAPIAPGRDEYEVRVRTPDGTREVLLTDVGFGVSQVLPVVVECLYAPPGSTVIMEQPEIHLHPSVQSGLADVLIDAIGTYEEGRPRNVQLVVESHSEHLLRRLLRRIAEEAIDPATVACYVVTPGRDGSRIEPLDVDAYGAVRNWPADFFGDPAEDLVARSRSARQRRRRAEERRPAEEHRRVEER
ncbi:MAG: AAA family ATPase [Gordonia sp. (in: high G+C Gram-positive bacteria)]|uniref:AAA family ATPase n=1 Tax=Gordonia sp. (in: high G+C Gram-positive bacteria) TaxID=84139 RepID=UPI0039E232D5